MLIPGVITAYFPSRASAPRWCATMLPGGSISLVHTEYRRARPPRRRHRRRLGKPRLLGRPGAARRATRLGGRADRHRLGAAGHVHGRDRDRRAHHQLRAAGGGAPRLLASGAFRQRGGNPRSAQQRPAVGQRRQRCRRLGRLRRRRSRQVTPLPAHPRIHPTGPPAVERGRRHLPRRVLRRRTFDAAAPPVRCARRPVSEALFRRSIGGRRAGRRNRRRRPTVLGRAAGRHRRTHQPAQVVVRQARSRARAAGVRPSGDHAGARHVGGSLARRRGEGRQAGRHAHHAVAARPGGVRGPAAAGRACRARGGDRFLLVYDAEQVRRGRRRARRGWSARRSKSPPRCADMPTSVSPTSCCRTPRTSRRRSGSATSCCRCCAPPPPRTEGLRAAPAPRPPRLPDTSTARAAPCHRHAASARPPRASRSAAARPPPPETTRRHRNNRSTRPDPGPA